MSRDTTRGARLAAPLFLFLLFCASCSENENHSTDCDSFSPDHDIVSSLEDGEEEDNENTAVDKKDTEETDNTTSDSFPSDEDDSTLPDGIGADSSLDETVDDDSVTEPLFLSLSVTMNPNEAAPLVGVITATTSQPTRLRVTLDSDEGTETLRYAPLATEHRLPILGLLPDHTYTVRVSAETAEKAVDAYPGTFTLVTPPLHPEFPDLRFFFHQTESKREPGYLFATISVPVTTPVPCFQVVAIDDKGRIRWTHDAEETQHGMYDIPNGHLLLQSNLKISEIDLFGDVVGEWRPEGTEGGPLTVFLPGITRFHHSVALTAANTIVTLDDDFRVMEDYPTSDTDPNAPKDAVTLRADTIVEFTRDGTMVEERHLLDMLDPYRFGYDLIPGYQWSHSNRVLPVPTDDSIIVSLRHQSCLVKYDRKTGDIRWILGNHHNWDPVFAQYLLTPIGSPFSWQWYQHYPVVTPEGTILVFDNGNFKAMPFDPPVPDEENWSRAVEYRIDETLMTVEQVWEWYPDEANPIFVKTLGGVHYLPQTGNVLVIFSNTPDPETTEVVSRIFEVTHSLPAQPIYELRIRGSVISTFHRSSLYPDGMLEE